MTTTSTATRRRISAGRPKPLSFSNAILLDLESVMVLDGQSARGLFQSAGLLSLLRGLERALRLGLARVPPVLGRALARIAEKAPEGPLRDLFLRAVDQQDAAAQAEIVGMGLWATFHAARFDSPPRDEPPWTAHFVEIAKASRIVDEHLFAGAYQAAAAELSGNAQLRPYLNDRSLARLADARDQVGALPSRLAGVAEVLLANVARMDIAERSLLRTDMSFKWLLDAGPDGHCRPGRQFTRMMVRRIDAHTLEGVLALAVDPNHPDRNFVDLATLKRWHSGEHFPSREKVATLLRTILMRQMSVADADVELRYFGRAFWAASRLHKTLELVEIIDSLPLPDGTTSGVVGLLGNDSLEAWARARYDHWLEHWQRTL